MKGLNFGYSPSARGRVRSTPFGVVLLLGLGLVASGCDPEEAEPDEERCEPPAGERGTAECKRWHAAICDFAARCGVFSHCMCIDQASAIACASDAQATSCADQLESASCSSPPSGCDLTDLADRTVAQAGCELFIDTACAADQRCTGSDPATCTAELETQIDCTRAVGLKPAFDQCIAELQVIECTASEGPESCTEAVLGD